MNLRDLHYLTLLAETKSFRKAAELAHVSQPTLSAQIRKMEDTLGLSLFERNSRNVTLTQAGEAILHEAKAALAHVTAMKAIATAHKDPLSGEFRLGVIASLSPFLTPDLLAEIAHDAPRLTVIIREGLTDDLLAALQAHELDAALIATDTAQNQFISRPVFDEPFLLATSKDHKLAAKPKITAQDIRGSNLLLLEEGHCLRDQALAVCMTDTVDARVKATSLMTLARLVELGQGVTLLPALAAPIAPNAALRDLPGLDAKRTVRLVARTSFPHTAALDVIAACCVRVARSAQID
jgi:LysR family hydrogen peroxide-inducible transcriptional activator